MSEWHKPADKLPAILADVEVVWSDGDEPSVIQYRGSAGWRDMEGGYYVPTPLKWREIEE